MKLLLEAKADPELRKVTNWGELEQGPHRHEVCEPCLYVYMSVYT